MKGRDSFSCWRELAIAIYNEGEGYLFLLEGTCYSGLFYRGNDLFSGRVLAIAIYNEGEGSLSLLEDTRYSGLYCRGRDPFILSL